MSLEQAFMSLLGVAVGLVVYWATRLEAKVNTQESEITTLRVTIAQEYVCKDDCRLTSADVRTTLGKIEEKLDRLIERKP